MKRVFSVLAMFIFALSFFAGCDLFNSNSIEKLEIITTSAKTEFLVGEDFSAAGLVVKAVYSNGDKEDITEKAEINASFYNKNVATSYNIKVTYKNKSKYYSVSVVTQLTQKTVTGISVNTAAAKTIFELNEVFSSAGLVVSLTYSDSTTQVLPSGYEVDSSNYIPTLEGAYEIFVTYGSHSTSYDVTVQQAENGEGLPVIVTDYRVVTTTVQRFFMLGTPFNSYGLIFQVEYSNGQIVDYTPTVVNSHSYNPNLIGTYTITVNYEGLTDTYTVTVSDRLVQPE